MLPVIALAGRPNVGKSTLFNALTRSRDALVADLPGLTRDRQYGLGKVGPQPYIVVDTGGLRDGRDGSIDELVSHQALLAIEEADVVLLLVDGRDGLSGPDQDIVARLRRLDKPLQLVVNKTEGLDSSAALAEFYSLGLELAPLAISASHRRGLNTLMEQTLANLPGPTAPEAEEVADRLRLAVVGRPNVGKSTLINRLLGEQRVLAFDQPGTTRDSVAVPFDRAGKHYTLIDTAGVRRRSRVSDSIEKFSIIKTLQAIEQADVIIMMVDARQGIAEQDATLLGFILDSGRALVLAVNKWDRLADEQRRTVRDELDRRLTFIDFAATHFISALHGSGVMDLWTAVDDAHRSATRDLSTAELSRILQQAVTRHPPPRIGGFASKLRYAHQGGKAPPLIVIHGNRTEKLPAAYRRYLINVFRKTLRLRGTPIRLS